MKKSNNESVADYWTELKKKISVGFTSVFAQLPKTIKEEYKIIKIGDFLRNDIYINWKCRDNARIKE
ncbi:hypothetical protein [Clostridium sp. E02]|uniref:hypothetical protein n=1 Tax=Clostridium sp. E02 TaxID=2487134 RepID=UPI000F539507|nr:hypothetical protein [Clostridium sp. E02]